MFNKIKSFVKANAAKISAFSLAIFGSVVAFGHNAFAAVDADVASTSQTVVTTLKENVTGIITANIANIVIVGVIIFGVLFVWKLSKKIMSGR
jgi:hypothetical protein